MEIKTVRLENDTHMMMKDIQLKLAKLRIRKTMPEINDAALRYGIDNVFEVLSNSKERITVERRE